MAILVLYEAARKAVADLRSRGCSLVICLSHLGYRYRDQAPSDTRLAQEVDGIDLVLGGHTHTFMNEPDVYSRPDGGQTLVNQVGFAGIRLGRIDVALRPQTRAGGATTHQPRVRAWTTYPVDASLD